ncbi:MAG: serine/threonine-protein kinase, partial [Gemmatimonadaceae bacterium]
MSSQESLQSLRTWLADRYVIERELGRGGMGAVYLARDIKLDRHVALKVLPPEFAVQPMLRDRFLRETRTAAGFSHPNIVPVYAVEESDNLLAYAMGYVEGESLMERVSRAGPLTVRETVKLMQDVAYALAYAHGRGIVHRDIKPDNIMIDRASGRALVMDFGIARAKSNAPAAAAGLTRVGEVVGTPEYMSPEQASGDDVDGRSDLYSLGLTIMFAVTGQIAFSAETTQRVLVKQLTESLPPVNTVRPDLPNALAVAIDRCVMKNPSERFDTAEGLVDALDNSQLITADVPLPIRLFQQEASTLSSIVLAFVFSVIYIWRSSDFSEGNDDSMLVLVTFFAIVVTRAIQTLREAERLAVSGFSASDISVGLARVLDEREARRGELRADPVVVRTRRRTVAIGFAMLVGAAASFKLALGFRELVRPGYYHTGPWGTVLIVMSLFYVGVGLVLLFKSPLRMPAAERFFRAVWLGGIGQ